MTPSEKHLETAEKITNDYRMIEDGCEGDLIEIIAAALAQAERDGMKRAAELARTTPTPTPHIKNPRTGDDGTAAIRLAIHTAILSESGDD